MKKQDLEAKVIELTGLLNKERKEHETEKKMMSDGYEKSLNQIQDDLYSNWKNTNAEFMNRYLKEMISTGQLSFNFEDSFCGYFDMSVMLNGDVLQTCSGHININRNSLEE